MLLDSHVVLWLAAADPSLGPRAREAILSAGRVFASSITMLELEIKRLSGRLTMPTDFTRSAFDELGLAELPFVATHASRLGDFPELLGHDPFDRSLLAQAVTEGLRFYTADRRLLALGRPWIHDARE
ncbi:MAG: type II toxin-antitoxin system VapC family toxin [Nocardioidaceae bacterium]